MASDILLDVGGTVEYLYTLLGPRWMLLGTALTVWALHYFMLLHQRPYVYFSGTRSTRILELCPAATTSFSPALWCLGSGTLQTLAGTWPLGNIDEHTPPAPPLPGACQYSREFIQVSTGRTVSLDWLPIDDRGTPPGSGLRPQDCFALLIILNDGIGGALVNGCIIETIQYAKSLGFACVVVNLPGAGGTVAPLPAKGGGGSLTPCASVLRPSFRKEIAEATDAIDRRLRNWEQLLQQVGRNDHSTLSRSGSVRQHLARGPQTTGHHPRGPRPARPSRSPQALSRSLRDSLPSLRAACMLWTTWPTTLLGPPPRTTNRPAPPSPAPTSTPPPPPPQWVVSAPVPSVMSP
ncbi:Phospholipase abhd3, variant 2 [Perkinsus olseni]|uniref:Phospholipase abhd3, variant 2 n=1 Tax=Perkinsus olseni TaxID=32597 RepID=A0A7J6SPP2_PEROL|nr:Phospholipase abhd3, variant 2 [Perkinsus olseni]